MPPIEMGNKQWKTRPAPASSLAGRAVTSSIRLPRLTRSQEIFPQRFVTKTRRWKLARTRKHASLRNYSRDNSSISPRISAIARGGNRERGRGCRREKLNQNGAQI